jgi:hypothetical protein
MLTKNLLLIKPATKNSEKMKKSAAAALLSITLVTVFLLILAPDKTPEKIVVEENVVNKAALSTSTLVPASSPTTNSSQTQRPTSVQGQQQSQSTLREKALPLPSPFIVAVFIIGLVAVFGLVLSLFLRKRSKRKPPQGLPQLARQLFIGNCKTKIISLAKNLGYSLHSLRLRSSSMVWFNTALSSYDLMVETGKQTTTLPSNGLLNPNILVASSVKPM